jgi:uncharacterized protein YdaU (DUF1376 family)
MSKAPAMPLFCGDYLKDTPDLSLEEHGAYLLLLMYTWANGCKPLPDDDDRLARRLRVTRERWQKKLRPVLEPLFDLTDGTWRSHRLEKEWAYVQERIAHKREIGAKGGRPRTKPPENGPKPSASNREDFSQSSSDKPLKYNDTAKPTGFPQLNLQETYSSPSSAYAEESRGDSPVSVDSNPARGRVAEPTRALQTSGVVVPIGRLEVLPDRWVLPDEWRWIAEKEGLADVDGSAFKFAMWWRGRRDRGERDAAKSASGWADAWLWWVKGDVKREQERGHGRRYAASGSGTGRDEAIHAGIEAARLACERMDTR